ncbi:hypothetical protein BaRGS_00035764, partial [Batillaria attramentaria]
MNIRVDTHIPERRSSSRFHDKSSVSLVMKLLLPFPVAVMVVEAVVGGGGGAVVVVGGGGGAVVVVGGG